MMSQTSKLENVGLLALRIAVGAVFIAHGWAKLNNIEGVTGMMGMIGLPMPLFWAYLVGLVEFVGGIAVLLGVYLRIASLLLAINMIVALLTLHIKGPWSAAELAVAMLGGALALLETGGGKWKLTDKDWVPSFLK